MSNGVVLVTGASGFIAKHVVRSLLAAGFSVRGSLRDLGREKEVRDAVGSGAGTNGDRDQRLSFVPLDLAGDEGWSEALSGTDALVHTASPFPMDQPKDMQDLVGPAIEGTLRALRAADASGVRRAVITSSTAAVMYKSAPSFGEMFDENDWTDTSSSISHYTRSKTLAERAAWEFVANRAPGMKLTAINPGLVLGAPLNGRFGTSVQVIQRLIASKDPAVPDVSFPIVDVEDVARAHAAALETPEAEGRRFIVSGGTMSMPEMARLIAELLPERRIVTRRAPDLLIRLIGLFDSSIATIRDDLGRRPLVSSAAAREVLGITFREPREAVARTVRYLVDHGYA